MSLFFSSLTRQNCTMRRFPFEIKIHSFSCDTVTVSTRPRTFPRMLDPRGPVRPHRPNLQPPHLGFSCALSSRGSRSLGSWVPRSHLCPLAAATWGSASLL